MWHLLALSREIKYSFYDRRSIFFLTFKRKCVMVFFIFINAPLLRWPEAAIVLAHRRPQLLGNTHSGLAGCPLCYFIEQTHLSRNNTLKCLRIHYTRLTFISIFTATRHCISSLQITYSNTLNSSTIALTSGKRNVIL